MTLYALNFSDFNLQSLCQNVHLFEISMSEAVAMQAIDYYWHLSQTQTILVYKYHIVNSFNTCQVMQNLEKLIFRIIAQLNQTLFQLDMN